MLMHPLQNFKTVRGPQPSRACRFPSSLEPPAKPVSTGSSAKDKRPRLAGLRNTPHVTARGLGPRQADCVVARGPHASGRAGRSHKWSPISAQVLSRLTPHPSPLPVEGRGGAKDARCVAWRRPRGVRAADDSDCSPVRTARTRPWTYYHPSAPVASPSPLNGERARVRGERNRRAITLALCRADRARTQPATSLPNLRGVAALWRAPLAMEPALPIFRAWLSREPARSDCEGGGARQSAATGRRK